jgi:hypothetical protein
MDALILQVREMTKEQAADLMAPLEASYSTTPDRCSHRTVALFSSTTGH